MSTTNERIQVPPVAEIRKELAAVVEEARALRKLLRLAEAATRVEQARNRPRQSIRKGGRRDA